MLAGQATALLSIPLFTKYEDVLTRPDTQNRCPLSRAEQGALLDALFARSELVEVYYRWRPNLRDEGDNHVLELAVAAGDAPIVTFNRRDVAGGQLRFPDIQVLTPDDVDPHHSIAGIQARALEEFCPFTRREPQ